ncbi:MAG TPA: DUF4135 domain-containing protein [Nakamurella sp.]|nr:DUF4135 domain-containing protein [Nakamurella sp.]
MTATAALDSITGEPVGSVTGEPDGAITGEPVGSVTGVLAGQRVSALLGVLARASTPAERFAGGWLRPTGDPAIAQQRLDRWCTRIADGRPERVAEILAEHGLTLDQWRSGLRDVTAVPGEPPPRWARDALTLLAMVGHDTGPHRVPRLREVAGEGLPDWVDPDQPWRFHPGFRDWMALASADVLTWTKTAPIADRAREELVLDLARRQLMVSGPLLMAAAAGRPADDPLFAADPRGDWESLWFTHPVVARLLATVWRQWRETTAELCGRITADLPSVAPGVEVARIELSAGDQHCGGRGVARLWLSDGTSVFLKPRSDGLHRVLGPLLARVDAAGTPLGISPALSLPEIIERDGYTWAREVPAGECRDDAAVNAYFRRAGALLRVVQAMGATDLHHENFVPAADLPVLVDLETVVAPGPRRSAPADDRLAERLSDTPGPTSMVTSAISGQPGRTSADIGSLAGPFQALTPYGVRTLVRTAVGPELRSTRAPLVNGAALPRRAGLPVALRGHEEALIDGYAEAHRRLASLATDTATATPADHPGAVVAEPAVRFVARPTRIYARLLVQSTAPSVLVDGVEREFVLELLYRATGTAPRGLIGCEVEAMRDLDIPLFTVPFTRTDLVSDRGAILADVLTEAPGTRTRRRLGAVAARDDHVDDLRATLFAMDPDAHAGPGRIRIPGAADTPVDTRVDRTEPVALLLDRAIDVGDDTLGWIGLEHDPNRNRWTYGRLSAGLTGQAGIGLALATVAASGAAPAAGFPTGCAAAARAALLGSVQRIGRGERGPADAFSGPAGVLYAAAVAARLLGDADLLDAARSLVVPCLRAARRNQPSVVIDGAAGAILALLQLPQDAATADALAELTELTELAENLDTATPDDVDPPDPWSASLPSRAFGVALARHQLARHQPAGHRPTGNTTTELPVPAGPGDEIACATVHSPVPPTGPLPVGTDLRTLLDQGVLAQAAFNSSRDPAWAARRDRVVDALVTGRERTGRWAAPLIAPDTALLSPIHGMAALAVLCTDLGPELPIARALT